LKFTLPINENLNCYATRDQRVVLLELIKHNIPGDTFFLTGVTALSVFYLHHRTSNDLDFFSTERVNISEIDFMIKSVWGKEYIKLKETSMFLSSLIKNIKVEFIIDKLSFNENREKFALENKHFLLLDTINNIFSNKFATIVSRNEPKDYLDFYYIHSKLKSQSFEKIYTDALKKDVIFEDAPNVAFQIEEGINFIQTNPELIPPIMQEINWQDFYAFYTRLIDWIYNRIRH